MGKRTKNSKFEDDGRVIAPMNVEGMPWYKPPDQRTSAQSPQRRMHDAECGIDRQEQSDESSAQSTPPLLTRSEKLAFSFGVLKAALLVSLVFIGALLAFILFCTEIWFR